jgi:hypothetical protein
MNMKNGPLGAGSQFDSLSLRVPVMSPLITLPMSSCWDPRSRHKDASAEPGVIEHPVYIGLAGRVPRCVPGRFLFARGVLHGREPIEQDIPSIPSDHHRHEQKRPGGLLACLVHLGV